MLIVIGVKDQVKKVPLLGGGIELIHVTSTKNCF